MIPTIAFVCVHNSCRSQIAEALGTYLGAEAFMSYSAGTEIAARINVDAVRHMRERYGIDMEERQRPKVLADIPPVDIVVTMGCNVQCPTLPCRYREDWGLKDPSGALSLEMWTSRDEAFEDCIKRIHARVLDLKERIQTGRIAL